MSFADQVPGSGHAPVCQSPLVVLKPGPAHEVYGFHGVEQPLAGVRPPVRQTQSSKPVKRRSNLLLSLQAPPAANLEGPAMQKKKIDNPRFFNGAILRLA